MGTLYLIRHAEAEGNLRQVYHGMTDGHLTDAGRAQLPFLTQRFADVPLTAVYTSPLTRAQETARAVLGAHGVPFRLDAELREIDGGLWEDRTWTDIIALWPEVFNDWNDRPHLAAMPEGETVRHVCDRVYAALCRIARENPDGVIAAVSHACAIKAALTALLGRPLSDFTQLPWSDNTGVCCFDYACAGETVRFAARYLADGSHLPNSADKALAL